MPPGGGGIKSRRAYARRAKTMKRAASRGASRAALRAASAARGAQAGRTSSATRAAQRSVQRTGGLAGLMKYVGSPKAGGALMR